MNVKIAESTIHGRGVFAVEPIRKGHWQLMYGYTIQYCPGRPDTAFGFWNGDPTMYVPYAPFCFLNHSARPNCDVEWYETGSPAVYALRRILAGEELTICYGEEPE